jgi:chemotaxis protein CheX
MAATQLITDAVIEKSIVDALRNVTQTMLQRDVTLVGQTREPSATNTFEIIDTVGFTGNANGAVHLCMSEHFAYHVIGLMLGMSLSEIIEGGPDVIKDAIGEITNMTAGGFKNQLCDLGFPCVLTLPVIQRGTNISVAPGKTALCHLFEFKCDGHSLVADIRLQAN